MRSMMRPNRCRYGRNVRILASAILVALLWCAGCGSKPASQAQSAAQEQPEAQTVERVRSEAAKILKKEATQIDVAKPLVAQGADELDIVEIVMAVEEAFKVEIPDSAIDDSAAGGKTLTVQKLAQIVSAQRKSK